MTKGLVSSDVRFLEYRLDVISNWPPSARKHAVAEGISRRLAGIARSTLIEPPVEPHIEDLLALSCRLLDDAFQVEAASSKVR